MRRERRQQGSGGGWHGQASLARAADPCCPDTGRQSLAHATLSFVLTPHRIALLALLLLLPACTSKQRLAPTQLVAEGSYTRARAAVADRMTDRRSERQYLLDRMKLAVLTLDDGYPAQAQPWLEETYDILRTQGINRDKTVASVVINEDLKFWKGEPFEQALSFAYYAMQQAMLGQWDNTRAAAGGSLFGLRDFGEDAGGRRIDTLGIMRRALDAERAAKAGGKPVSEEEDYFNTGYAVRDSNFVLGYLLHGLASQQMARPEEANDYFAAAVQIDPTIRGVVDRLRAGDYNTILVVAYGLGPRKIAYGPDNVLTRFAPRTPSDDAPLEVMLGGRHVGSLPVVTDVNRMAIDHMWNNLEDVREAKSFVGNVLLLGGGAATAYGISQRDDIALYAGLGSMAAGLFAKAGAHADTRYCEVFPQRFYLVPLRIVAPGEAIDLQVRGQPGSRMILAGLGPPTGRGAPLRYVRLNSSVSAPQWATSGRVFYGNDWMGPPPEGNWPYILGGRDVRTPSPAVLTSYHQAGYLTNLTVADLSELYRAEGVDLSLPQAPKGVVRHLLEGGPSLAPPMAGTAGFARLFGQPRPPYEPKSDKVRELASRINPLTAPADQTVSTAP